MSILCRRVRVTILTFCSSCVSTARIDAVYKVEALIVRADRSRLQKKGEIIITISSDNSLPNSVNHNFPPPSPHLSLHRSSHRNQRRHKWSSIPELELVQQMHFQYIAAPMQMEVGRLAEWALVLVHQCNHHHAHAVVTGP